MNVLTVGSCVIDVFLRPSASHVNISKGLASFTLGDKVPTDIDALTLGGNGSNVSVGLSRLEHEVAFYSYLGTDALSSEIEEIAKKEGINLIADKNEQERAPLSLIFDLSEDRIIFSHHQKKNHTFSYTKEANPDMIYLTSIGQVWTQAYENVLSFAKEGNVPIALSPGSSQLDNINSLLIKVLSDSKLLFLNKEEGEKIAKYTNKPHDTIKNLLLSLHSLGPKIVSVTDGPLGAYASDGQKFLFIDVFDKDKVVEKTGAGDSYASAFLAAFLFNESLEQCMRWGGANSHSVTQFTGAQKGLLDKDLLNKLLSQRQDYQAKQLS